MTCNSAIDVPLSASTRNTCQSNDYISINNYSLRPQGKLSEKWSLVTKAAIAESILNLTRLDEIYRTHENCVKTATLWLALASLCVLDQDHVQKYVVNFSINIFLLELFII